MSDPKPSASTTKNKSFKPKNVVRKSKAERDAHAKEEAEKAAVRAAAAVQAAGKPAQTNKSGPSKRREQARDSKDSNQGPSGGVFGAGVGTRQAWKRTHTDGGHSEILEGQEGVKPSDGPILQGQESSVNNHSKRTSASTNTGSRALKLVQDGVEFDTDDGSNESRRDIEMIWISSDDETMDDKPVTGKGKARAASVARRPKQKISLRPVRAPRARDEDSEAGTQRSDTPESQDDIEEMDIADDQITDPSRAKQDTPSSPELSKKTKPGRKLKSRAKDSRMVAETVEDRAERKRLKDDVKKLKQEFINTDKIKKDDDAEEDDGGLRPDGKYFLLQFPPLVPFLADHASTLPHGHDNKQQVTASGLAIKSDPDGSVEPNSATGEHGSGSGPALPKEGVLTASESIRLPPGRIGKLKVHKSGKVTLDWGGTDMEVRYGTEVNFLQDAVLVETPSQSSQGEEKALPKGTTYALGQVETKLVVIPDWQKLYD